MIIPKKKKLNIEFYFHKNYSIYRFKILFMSWLLFYDKNRKIFYKFCKNNFLNNLKIRTKAYKKNLRHGSLHYNYNE